LQSRYGVLEGVLVVTLILFVLFAFLAVSSRYMTVFYGVPVSGGVISSPDKAEVVPVSGTDALIFSPTRAPAGVTADDSQRALSLLSIVPSAPAVSPSGLVPFAMSAGVEGDSVVDPYRDVSITLVDRDQGMVLLSSSAQVPLVFGNRQSFFLGVGFTYRSYVFSVVSSSGGRTLFLVSGSLGSPVYFVCLEGVPNFYSDPDSGVCLKVLVRGSRVTVWSG